MGTKTRTSPKVTKAALTSQLQAMIDDNVILRQTLQEAHDGRLEEIRKRQAAEIAAGTMQRQLQEKVALLEKQVVELEKRLKRASFREDRILGIAEDAMATSVFAGRTHWRMQTMLDTATKAPVVKHQRE